MDFLRDLRLALHSQHEQIEKLPYAIALADGRLPRAGYVELLREMFAIHSSLETELARHAELACVYLPENSRLEAVSRDLSILESPSISCVAESTQTLCDRIAKWSRSTPCSLLGCLYVLEGSRMGSLLLIKPIARIIGVTPAAGRGLDYHLQGVATRVSDWTQFKNRLAAYLGNEMDRTLVHDGAVETFAHLNGLYRHLSQTMVDTGERRMSMTAAMAGGPSMSYS